MECVQCDGLVALFIDHIRNAAYSHFLPSFPTTMPRPRPPQISSRKQPQQARSTELVEAVLQAATQVLAQQGTARFTTARVAERAGVSVGSVYQYFPNKAAILFRLQSDEWTRTTELLQSILEDASKPPLERLRALVHAFVQSECEESELRVALHDAEALYRDAPEAHAVQVAWDTSFSAFMKEILPDASKKLRAQAGDLMSTTLLTVAKEYSASARSGPDIKSFSDAMADMFSAYISGLAAR